ncbi:aggregation-promoting factor C-terminal-like domain-containing protein [Streptomyces chartreusis]
MASITSLHFLLTSNYVGNGIQQARRDITALDDSLNKLDGVTSSAAKQLTSVTNAVLAFGPALIPVATAATGVAGGLAASTLAASAAAGIFGGALVGAITKTVSATKDAKSKLEQQQKALSQLTPGTEAYEKQLKKVNEAQKVLNDTIASLTPTQRKFYNSIGDMTAAWAVFIEKTEKDTLTPTSIAMDAVSRNMGKFIPVVKAVSPLITNLANDFARWMDGKGLDRFIDTVVSQGVPALDSFIRIGQNVIGVLGKGFRDFLPFGNQVVANLADGAERLKGWADGGGFQRFLDRVHEVAPSVKEFFGALTDALQSIAKAAGDLSGTSLTVLTVLLQVLGSLPPELLANLVRAWLAWNSALLAYNIIAGIASAVTAGLALATSGIGILMIGMAVTVLGVTAALAALAVGIFFLIKYWDEVSGFLVDLWGTVWGFIKKTALTVWDFLTNGWGQVCLAFMGPLGLVILVWKNWETIWGAIKTAALAVWDALKVAWSAFTGWLQSVWNVVWPALLAVFNAFVDPLKDTWNTLWPELKTAAQNVWNFLQAAWGLLWAGMTVVWNAFWGTFGGVFKTAWSGIVDSAVATWNLLTSAWQLVWSIIQGVYTTAWALLKGAWEIGWSFLTNSARIAWAILTGAWQTVWAVVRGIWDVFYAAFSGIFTTAWNVVVAIATGIWNTIKAVWDALWKSVTAIFSTFLAIFTGNWGAAWNAIKDAAVAIWNVLRTAWDAFLKVVMTLLNGFINTAKAVWNAFWNAVQSVATTFWNALKNLFQTSLTAVKNFWDTTWNAIRNFFQTLVNAVISIAQAFWNTMRAAFQAGLTAVQSTWNTVWTAIRTFFSTLRDGIVTTATNLWDRIRDLFSAGSSWLRTTFWNPVRDFFTKTIPGAFESAKEALGKAWAGIKKLVRDPIQAVVDIVYNKGIVKLWNVVAGVFGAKKLDSFSLPQFKEGGPTGPGASKGMLAVVHPNEHMWTADEVRAAGGHQAVARMRSAVLGGKPVRTFGTTSFEDGGGLFGTGLGPDVGPDLVPDGIIGNALNKLKNLALGAISGPFNAAVDSMAKGAKSVIRSIVPGDGLAMETLTVGMVDKIAETVKSWVKTNDVSPTVAGGSVEAALSWARSQVGKPYQWGGVGPGGYDCSGFMSAIQNVIMGKKPNQRVWATGAFSGGSAPSGWKLREKAPFMVGITNTGVGHTAGTLNGVNVESAGGVGVRVGSSARGYNNGMFTHWYGFLPSKSAGGGNSVAAAKSTAKSLLSNYGWASNQWSPLEALWTRESGWNYKAKNPSSGAYGIPQALPASKMASAGADYLTNATTQIRWGLGYIKGRYGSPSSANSFQRANNWYALGTPGANAGWGVVGEHEPEVIKFRGGERVDPLSDLVGRGGGGDVHVSVPITIQGRADHGVVDRLEQQTIPKLTMAIKQGVGKRN